MLYVVPVLYYDSQTETPHRCINIPPHPAQSNSLAVALTKEPVAVSARNCYKCLCRFSIATREPFTVVVDRREDHQKNQNADYDPNCNESWVRNHLLDKFFLVIGRSVRDVYFSVSAIAVRYTLVVKLLISTVSQLSRHDEEAYLRENVRK
jgi:hypothetical protein